ncbi:hypothetical protein RWA06_31115 (plasmid) [Sinorhizobium meliloti]|uniref:hypothetical protein n=1 Tax=Rhizobium meliloti TaxID=382 RepID=UPI00299D6B8A|nr:hypothetical protein [Sinorhizobium meliloti]MDW9621995.1 hypothetical protein [Sinorhizobium meliloti]MDX0011421.1 hypothetical protein [Sinorhizobium meliloti]MDX0160180.1 hypothetical protein [Sinorhizobium meliloti]MDX0179244.1 hypothetical protein [Sinorhizobium meliloti]
MHQIAVRDRKLKAIQAAFSDEAKKAIAKQRLRQIEEGRPMIPQYRVFALAVAVAIGLLMLLLVRAGTAGLL